MTIRGIVMMPSTRSRAGSSRRGPRIGKCRETRAQSRVIDRFLSNLRISAVRYSRLVDVTYRSGSWPFGSHRERPC